MLAISDKELVRCCVC